MLVGQNLFVKCGVKNMVKRNCIKWYPLALCLLAVILIAVMPADAAPGGVIKAAAKNIWVQIGFGALTVLFLPLIIWWSAKRWKHIQTTKKALQALAVHHGQYHWLTLRDRTADIFQWVWTAWTDQKMSQASNFMTHWYWQNQQLILDRWAKQGLTNVCEMKKIVNITPIFVQHVQSETAEGSRVVMEINAKVIDYLQDSSGNVVEGDKKVDELTTIWTLMWDGGAWRLSMIEDEACDINYIGVPNEVPTLVIPTQRQEESA
jgi:hypothetical protein